MNFNVLDYSKFASRMPQIAQILVLTFKIFWGAYPRTPKKYLFSSLAIPASEYCSWQGKLTQLS